MIAERGEAITSPSATVLKRFEELGRRLRSRGWTCATAESCTGGGIAQLITSIAGSSDYFLGGVVAYSNQAKMDLLGIPASILDAVGAVSEECAAAMVDGVRRITGADVALSSTGIAGPGGATARKPVGLVYIAVATPDATEVRRLNLDGDRLEVVGRAIVKAVDLALDIMGADAPETE